MNEEFILELPAWLIFGLFQFKDTKTLSLRDKIKVKRFRR